MVNQADKDLYFILIVLLVIKHLLYLAIINPFKKGITRSKF